MPTLYQIASYSQMFRLLRGRRPTVSETMRYFSDVERMNLVTHRMVRMQPVRHRSLRRKVDQLQRLKPGRRRFQDQ